MLYIFEEESKLGSGSPFNFQKKPKTSENPKIRLEYRFKQIQKPINIDLYVIGILKSES